MPPVPARILIVCLTWLSTWTVVTRVIVPNRSSRMRMVASLLDGSLEAPYQYRVLKHWLAMGLDPLLRLGVEAPEVRHVLAYGLLTAVTCLGIYTLLYRYLERWVGGPGALLGLLWLAASLPLSLTGFMMEGDLLTLLAYLIVLELLCSRRGVWVPLVVGLFALNREQILWAVSWQALWGWSQGALTSQKDRTRLGLEVLGSLLAWSAVQGGLRLLYGVKENPLPWPCTWSTTRILEPCCCRFCRCGGRWCWVWCCWPGARGGREPALSAACCCWWGPMP